MKIIHPVNFLFFLVAAGFLVYTLFIGKDDLSKVDSDVISHFKQGVNQQQQVYSADADKVKQLEQLVQSEMASLKLQLAKMREQIASKSNGLNKHLPDGKEVNNAQVLLDANVNSIEVVRKREKKAIDTFAYHLDLELSSDPVNTAVRDNRHEDIATYFDEQGFQSSQITGFDCSESLCKMTVRHEKGGERESFQELIGQGPLSAGSFYYETEDGRSTVLYAGIPNHEERFHQIMQAASKTLIP